MILTSNCFQNGSEQEMWGGTFLKFSFKLFVVEPKPSAI
jgi:hypothetical protein